MANVTSLDQIQGQNYVATPNNTIPQGTYIPPAQAVGTPNGANGNVQTAQANGNGQGYLNYQAPPVTQAQASGTSGTVVQDYLNNLLSLDSSYMRNATQQGMNVAGGRGLMNSSLAAGAAQASNINASMPILGEIMQLNNQREGQLYQAEQSQFDRDLNAATTNANQAFQGSENLYDRQHQSSMQSNQFAYQSQEAAADRQMQSSLQQQSLNHQANLQQSQFMYQSEQARLDRTQNINNMMLQAELNDKSMNKQAEIASLQAQQDYQFRSYLQSDAAAQQDWLSNQNYVREFNGTIAANNVKNATDMFNTIFQYAVDNPEVYTADVATGMQNYFTNSYFNMMDRYFGGST